jgi:hypothetical protein
MDERRQAIRWNVNLPVRYMGLPSHKEGAANTLDLSMTGARIETVEKHKPGDVLDLMMDIPGVANGLVCVEAGVIWQDPRYISEQDCNHMTGVVFRKIRDCHKQSILDYVIDNKSSQSGVQ